MILPGVILSAIMLALMIVHMESAYSQLHMKPVFSLYPQTQLNQLTIFFPHAIRGTDLVAECITAYSGPFVEDGSYDDVVGIAALTLRNCGTQTLECARIVFRQGTRCLSFQAQTILPGETALVLEETRQGYEQFPYYNCTAELTMDDHISALPNELDLSILDEDYLLIQNQTDRNLTNVQIEYKRWSYEQDLYIGGVTWKVSVGELSIGQTVTAYIPQVGKYNRIVRITYQ